MLSPPHRHPVVRTFGHCMTVRFGHEARFAGFSRSSDVNSDHLDCVRCYSPVRVTEDLVYVYHVALL